MISTVSCSSAEGNVGVYVQIVSVARVLLRIARGGCRGVPPSRGLMVVNTWLSAATGGLTIIKMRFLRVRCDCLIGQRVSRPCRSR